MKPRNLLLVLVFLCAGAGQRSDPNGAPDANPDPELERQAFHIADGWQINLFASDPMVQKPIGMNFDDKGRLWCATSETYPQLAPGKTPDDKIFVLEDTKREGKADKSTIFAEGLFIPTSVITDDGGAYVTNSTELLHLKDTKGTGKADTRRVVLSGFGTEDTHHIVHSLNWGPDGRLYFIQSIYIHSHLETPRGLRTLLGSGVWLFYPRTLERSAYSHGLVNPWGILWDRWGQTFETDGAGFQGMNYAFPGAGFESAVGMTRTLPGLNPSSPKYCGEVMLSGRNVPDDYQGDILTNDFRANRIVRFKMLDNGAGFTSKQMPDFLTSSDRSFRPVDLKMGPDGAIYIADWYSPIIQHGEVDFRDPRRDHVHGRIWRVTHKNMPLAPRPAIEGATVQQLLDQLKAPEDFTRQQARLALRERAPAEVLPALKSWLRKLKSSDPNADHHRLEALWTCQGLNQIDEELLKRVLESDEPRARAAAVRVAGDWADQLPDVRSLLAPMIEDEFPRVRLEAVRALANIHSPQSVVLATRVLDRPMDPVLEYALWLTCNDLRDIWLPALEAGKLSGWGKAEHLNYALRAVNSPLALKTLIQQLRSENITAQARQGILDLIAQIGGPEDANTLLDLALSEKGDESRTQLLGGLVRLSTDQHIKPSADPARVGTLLNDPNEDVRAQAITLVGLWKLQELGPRLQQIAQATEGGHTRELYDSVMKSLGELGDAGSRSVLEKLSAPSQRLEVREAAIVGLAQTDLKEAAAKAADLWSSSQANPSVVLNAFIFREGGTDALAAALQHAKLPGDTAKLALRILRESGHPSPALTGVLTAAAGLSSGPVKLSPEQMKQLIAEVIARGDAARGELVYRRADASCFQCHAIAGSGGWLAPDLSSIGAGSPIDYLIDSILDPNKAIKDGFQGYTVVTNSGEAYVGIKVRQDNTQLVLRDASRQEIPIPLSEIKAQKDIGSLMPTGLADPLTHQEFLDMIKFLSELGKPGPYGPTSRQFIRTWRVSVRLPAELIDAEPGPGTISLLERQTWDPVYSMVSGVLPADAIATAGTSIAYVRGQIDVTAPGKVRLILNSRKGLMMWVDGRPSEASTDVTLDLPRGTHTITFRIDQSQRGNDGLKVEVTDAPGSFGHAQPIAGR